MDNFELNDSDLNVTADSGQQTEAPPVQEDMFEYTANGKTVSENRETVLKRASQGYNYAQNMQQFNADKQAFEQSMQEREAKLREQESRWSQYDQYSRENPEWAAFVKGQWDNRQSFNGHEADTQATNGIPASVQSELSELRQFKEEFRGFMQNHQAEKEDAALNSQIEGTSKEYPDIDFKYSDPNTGKTLEFQVLEHMQMKGLNDFKAAFRDFYHDQLIARAVTKAKEDTGRQLQQRQQQGYIVESDTPLQGLQQPSNVKGKSYYDLVDEGIAELGIT